MTRPHCSNPARCSQCLGAPVRIVTLVPGAALVDGQPVQYEPHSVAQRRVSSKRGARANRLKHPPKPAVRRR